MSAATQLENMGLLLRLDQSGAVILGGLKELSPEARRQAVELAREHKPAILEELQSRAQVPVWIRAYRPGEVLDDAKERRCASPRCGAVLMRRGESDESWKNKIYCSGECHGGKPWLPVSEVLQ